jgi:hypothetical protein
MAKPVPTMQIPVASVWEKQRVFTAIQSMNDPITHGPYANDASAAAAGIPIGGQYYQASGAVHVRLT